MTSLALWTPDWSDRHSLHVSSPNAAAAAAAAEFSSRNGILAGPKQKKLRKLSGKIFPLCPAELAY